MEPLTPNPRATQAPRGCDGYAIRGPGYSIHDALALQLGDCGPHPCLAPVAWGFNILPAPHGADPCA